MKVFVTVIVAVMICLSSGEVSVETSLKQAVRHAGLKSGDIANPSEGSFKNCGVAKNFTFTWTPKEPSPRGSLFAMLNFVSPYDWSSGKGVLDVYLKEMPETPIIQINQGFTCNDVTKFLPQCPCPFKAGQLIHLTYTEMRLPSIPSGTYLIKVQVLNSQKQEVLCGKAEVEIQV